MRFIRRLYDWTLSWSDSPYGGWALFLLAFAESSFFPVPPDILLIALALGRPRRALRFALICSAGSLLGGMAGYLIGYQFWHLAKPILQFYHLYDKIELVGNLFRQYTAWAVGVAGFTPIPYKVFTIAGGYFRVHFGIFCLASAVSRSARFFIVAGLIRLFGEKMKKFIDRYFNLLTVAFTVLLVAGFVGLKYFFK